MGPPTIVPARAPSIAAQNPAPPSVPAEGNSQMRPAHSIAVPARGSTRPPAVAIAPPSSVRPIEPPRASVPVVAPTNRSAGPPSIGVANNSQPSLPVSTPISVPLPVSQPIPVPSSQSTESHEPLIPSHMEPPPAPPPTFDNAQIDPALLEAVVAALQHSEQARMQEAAAPQSAPPSTEPTGESSATPITAPKNPRRKSKNASATNEDGTTTSGQPRKRARRAASQTDENGEAPTTARRRRRSTTHDDASAEEQDTSGSDDELSSPAKKKRRGGRRKSRVPSPPPFDPSADPGEEIDPTVVTMGALCDDPGTGRVSSKAAQIVSNHAAWRAANREKRARMKAIMEAKKYGRDLEAEEENAETRKQEPASVDPSTAEEIVENPEAGPSSPVPGGDDGDGKDDDKGDDFDYSQALSANRYNAQVRIGPNGEMIVDEESLFVDQSAEDDTANYTHIEESDTTKFVNSATYSKKVKGSRWSAEETELFYDVCSCPSFA
ncbi:hypothetical protein K474DRAFT_1655447 [Panus rudis PR-1116 ss-1]|nr:hypothetical protein K474DRAFT_1655447 [Panus rudis PR-1116 ss-1]